MSYIRKRYGRRPRAMGGVGGVIQTLAAITGIAADVTYLRGSSAERRPTQQPMGDLATTITKIASTFGIATDIANDPYLAETVCHVNQLKAINAGQAPAVCPKTATGLPGGVGLGRFQKPLRAYVYAEQHTWVYAAAVVGVIGLPMLVGYALGRGSRR